MNTTTIEIHDDVRGEVAVLKIPNPLRLFAGLLFEALSAAESETKDESCPRVGNSFVTDGKIVMRYHGGNFKAALEWYELLDREEDVADEIDEEEDVQWWE